jgi:hypothetical protein
MSVCASPIKGEVIRLTLLNNCGDPIFGPGSAQVTTDAWTEVTATPNYEEGTRFLSRKANGQPCVNLQDPAFMNWVELGTTLCTLDVDLIAVATGEQPISDNAAGDFVGVTFGEGLLTAQYSFELWQPVAGDGECDEDGNQRWVYWAWPRVYNAQIQELTFTNDVFNFAFNSMTKRASARWDIGDPWLADTPTAVWDPGKHFAFSITSVQPPESACGAVEIES